MRRIVSHALHRAASRVALSPAARLVIQAMYGVKMFLCDDKTVEIRGEDGMKMLAKDALEMTTCYLLQYIV